MAPNRPKDGLTIKLFSAGAERKTINISMAKAKLEQIYGYAMSKQPRPLYRLTPHSLRHIAVTNFCRKNGWNVALTAKFARYTGAKTLRKNLTK